MIRGYEGRREAKEQGGAEDSLADTWYVIVKVESK